MACDRGEDKDRTTQAAVLFLSAVLLIAASAFFSGFLKATALLALGLCWALFMTIHETSRRGWGALIAWALAGFCFAGIARLYGDVSGLS